MKIPYRVHRGFLAAWKEVEDIIMNIDKYSKKYKEKYKKFNAKYNYLDDGDASIRVIKVIFKDIFNKKGEK